MSASWSCPGCKRHVPANVEVCRCGTPRGFQVEPWLGNRSPEPLPLGIKLGIGLLVLLAVGAVITLLRPAQPPRIVPLLGYETSAPSPSPRASLPRSPARR